MQGFSTSARTLAYLRSESTMATPKGMRATQFPVNDSDAIHIYSDATHIWLQLRRDVPTEMAIGRSSFKVALCMQPGTAQKLGLELMNLAARRSVKPPATPSKAGRLKA